jgi:hypothetical protein
MLSTFFCIIKEKKTSTDDEWIDAGESRTGVNSLIKRCVHSPMKSN